MKLNRYDFYQNVGCFQGDLRRLVGYLVQVGDRADERGAYFRGVLSRWRFMFWGRTVTTSFSIQGGR